MRQLHPSFSPEVDLTAAYAYPRDLTGRAWVRANMVSSVDGAAVVDGRSEGLSDPGDKKVFATLRGLCDAVVVGAGTARTEGYRALRARPPYADLRAALGQAPAPTLVVVSGRLALDPESELFHGGATPTIVVTPAASDRAQRDRIAGVADVVVAGDQLVDMGRALDELASRGLVRLLCEGGPHLLADVAAAGRLDELCLTMAPRVLGGGATRITAGTQSDVGLELAHLLEEDGTLFARYTRAPSAT
jgi:riboflavin biosynthesis pyrimidine reductase